MLYNNMFSQVNVLQKAAEASALRNEAYTNNIANSDTPGYKRQTVEFEAYLSSELDKKGYKSSAIDLEKLKPSTITENSQYNTRYDESNIDVEVEMTERSKNSLVYSTLTESITNNFKSLEIVLNSMK